MGAKIYDAREERANAITHALGIALGFVAGGYLLSLSTQSDNKYATLTVVVYLIGMLMSYFSSTFYHACKNAERKKLLRKFDHAAIYVHIAGTYTPLTVLIFMDKGYWGVSILSFVWLAAIVGFGLSFLKQKEHNYLETVCYVLMGCCVFVAFKPLWDSLVAADNISAFWWIIAGGISYIVGAIFYSFHKAKFMHSVFHIFVLGGSVCHIIAISRVL